MVRQEKTAAESCWDEESIDSDEKCEKYLKRKQEIAAEAEDADDADVDEDDDDDAEEDGDEDATDAEDDVTATGTDSEDDDDDDSEEEEENEPDDAEEEASTSRGAKMVRKKADGSKTKADYIREIISAKQAAGAELRPRDIIAALEKKGVEVNASQVSITLRSMGVPPSRKGPGKPATKPEAVKAEPETRRATLKRRDVSAEPADGDLTSHVEAAADFIHEVGGYSRALKLLDLCNKVLQRG
jgi:hypothetical protein